MLEGVKFDEARQSQLPFVEILLNMGYEYISTADVMTQRSGDTSKFILKDIARAKLMEINSYEHKGQDFKFEEKQVAEYSKSLNKILADDRFSDIDFEKDSGQIKQIAVELFNKYPEFKKMDRGQAMALEMAVEHYSALSKNKSGKKEDVKLKREVKKLKRKTSLDTSSHDGKISKSDFNKKRDELKQNRNISQREDFIMEQMNVDKYLPASMRGN